MAGYKSIKFLLLALGLVVLVIFISTIDLKSLSLALKKFNISILFIVSTLVVLNLIVKAIRWKFLVYKTSKRDITARFSFSSILAGVASGSLTPGRGEIAKPLMLKSYGIPLSEATAAAFIEKIFDMFALCLLFLISLIFFVDYKGITYIIYFAIAIFIFFLLFIAHLKKVQHLFIILLKKIPVTGSKAIEFSNRFFESFAMLKKKRVLALISLLSVSSMLLEIIRIFYIFTFFGLGVSFFLAMFSFSAAIVAGVISLVPGGIGINEISQTAIIAGLSKADTGLLKNAVLIDRLFAYYLLIFFGALVLMKSGAKSKNPNSKL